MSNSNLIRKLNSRERRRLNVYGILAVDAIDPGYSTRELVHAKTKLYRYGCNLNGTTVTFKSENVKEKRNFIFNFRGPFFMKFPFFPSLTIITYH